MLDDVPYGYHCCLGSIGAYQTHTMAMALALVHGVRAGLEDNVWFDREQTQLASNKMLLERVLMLGDTLDMTPAPLSTVRKWLKLQPGHGQYGVAAY